MIETPVFITYASLMSTEMVRKVLVIAILNDFEVKLTDILNIRIHASVTEKMWTTLSPKLIKDGTKTRLIIRV